MDYVEPLASVTRSPEQRGCIFRHRMAGYLGKGGLVSIAAFVS